MDSPRKFKRVIQSFSVDGNFHKCMITLLWEDDVMRCPVFNSSKATYLEGPVRLCYGDYAEKNSLKVGTATKDSPVSLEKWIPVTSIFNSELSSLGVGAPAPNFKTGHLSFSGSVRLVLRFSAPNAPLTTEGQVGSAGHSIWQSIGSVGQVGGGGPELLLSSRSCAPDVLGAYVTSPS